MTRVRKWREKRRACGGAKHRGCSKCVPEGQGFFGPREPGGHRPEGIGRDMTEPFK